MKLRQIVLPLHQLLGLTLGVLLLVIGVSGSSIALSEETDRWLNPTLYPALTPGQTYDVDQLVTAFRQTHPHQTPVNLTVFDSTGSGKVYRIGFTNPNNNWEEVFYNPYTGQLLGSRVWNDSFIGTMTMFHTTLLRGEQGSTVVMFCALGMVFISITGVLLWPGWRNLAQGLNIRWRSPWKLVTYDLHKVTGISVLLFLAVVGLTGAAIFFNVPVREGIYQLTGTPQPQTLFSKPILTQKPLTLAVLTAKAQQLVPEAELTTIKLDYAHRDAFMARFTSPQLDNLQNSTIVFLDRYSGALLRIESGEKAHLAERLLNAIEPLHTGRFGGFLTEVFYIFVGLAPGGLFLSGFALWLSKLRLKLKLR